MRPSVQWIITTLQTAKTEHLQQITILTRFPFDGFVETDRPEWQELDHLLVQLWTSRSIIPNIKYFRAQKRTDQWSLYRVCCLNSRPEVPPGRLGVLGIDILLGP